MSNKFIIIFITSTLLPSFIFSQNTDNSINEIFEKESGTVSPNKTDNIPAQNSIFNRSVTFDIMAAVDMVGSWDKEKNRDTADRGRLLVKDPEIAMEEKKNEWETEPVHATDNKATIRSGELGFYADIDQLARGIVTIGMHEEDGKAEVDLEEAYFLFPVTPVPGTSLKLGKFFYDAGRINTIHRHDWSFTEAPLVHRELFSEENAGDVGAELSILFPWPFWQELTIGVFNGQALGHKDHDHDDEESEDMIALENQLRLELGLPPRETPAEEDEESHSLETRQNPLVTVHLKQFFQIGENWGTQFGFSYMRWHPDSEANKKTEQSGIDFVLKWNRGRFKSFQWLTEIWYRETRAKGEHPWEYPDPIETRAGAYTLIEYSFHQNWSAALRFDGYHNPNYRGESGYMVSDATTESQFIVSWKPSEFSRFRFTASQKRRYLYNDIDNTISAQAVFIIGKHPEHVY